MAPRCSFPIPEKLKSRDRVSGTEVLDALRPSATLMEIIVTCGGGSEAGYAEPQPARWPQPAAAQAPAATYHSARGWAKLRRPSLPTHFPSHRRRGLRQPGAPAARPRLPSPHGLPSTPLSRSHPPTHATSPRRPFGSTGAAIGIWGRTARDLRLDGTAALARAAWLPHRPHLSTIEAI